MVPPWQTKFKLNETWTFLHTLEKAVKVVTSNNCLPTAFFLANDFVEFPCFVTMKFNYIRYSIALEITGTQSLRRTEAYEQNPDCLPGLSQCQTCHPTLGSWTGIDLPWSSSASASVCGARKVASQPVRWKGSLHRPSCSTPASEQVRYNSGKAWGLFSLQQQKLILTDQPLFHSLHAGHPLNTLVFQVLNNQVSHRAL